MKVELQHHHHQPTQQQRHLTNKNGNLPLDITSLEYHITDDQKLQANTDSNANKSSLTPPAIRQPMPVDLLEPCGDRHSGQTPDGTPATVASTAQHQHQQPDPDIVRQRDGTSDGLPAASVAYRMDISPEQSAVLLQPLTEAALLRRSGVDLMADIPMIDDDDDDVNDAPDAGSGPTVTVGAPSELASKPAAAAATTTVKRQVTAAEVVRPPLKSALRKGARPSSKKGMRVCFQNSSVYYIDTDAEANAEPQLLMVQSLDVPLVAATTADFRMFRAGSSLQAAGGTLDKKYTYEDAIVSLQLYSDVLGPGQYTTNADKVRIVGGGGGGGGGGDDDDDGEGEEEEEDDDESGLVADGEDVSDSAGELAATLTTSDTADVASETVLVASEVTEAVKEVRSDSEISAEEEAVQTLTVANLRQHEMMMEERDVEPDASSSGGSAERVEMVSTPCATPVQASMPEGGQTAPNADGKSNLSPPLKELTVDVLTVATPGAQAASGNWQVELSPLNSIPESETDSSSHSSQDTIIMMTTAEEERNEEHIRHSLVVAGMHQQQHDGDAASTVSSQDSDDTVKCDAEGARDQVVTEAGGRPCTSSQIREIMERNAQRRSLQRYSNTQKKRTSGGETVNAPSATDRLQQQQQQRTWKSQESLLDTIKLLTTDEGEEAEAESSGIAERRAPPPPRLLDGRSGDGSNLSLQDVRGLIAAVPPHAARLQQSRRASSEVSVPGDIRQWKMQANLWADVRRQQQQQQQQQKVSPESDVGHGSTEVVTNVERTGGVQRPGVPQTVSEEEDHYGYYGAGGYVDDGGDELARFVQNDSDRLERLRKRYSYTDGDDTYGEVGSFGNRRTSVRGIKPRFGSTSEILRQMQGRLHTPPMANPAMNGHLTWPYPETAATTTTNNNNNIPNRAQHHQHVPQQQRHSSAVTDSWAGSVGNYATLPTSFPGNVHPMMAARLSNATSRSAASLPTLTEEMYGTRPSNTNPRGHHDPAPPAVRTVRGRDGTFIQVYGAPLPPPPPPASAGQPQQPPHYQPPPYQPPPPPPPSVLAVQQHLPPPYDHHLQHRQFDQARSRQQQQQQQQHHFQPTHQHVAHHLQQNQQFYHSTSALNSDRIPLLVVAGSSSARGVVVAKDERGVPEGASASPKVTFDSLYAHVTPGGKVSPVDHRGTGTGDMKEGRRPASGSSSGTVYYAMQV